VFYSFVLDDAATRLGAARGAGGARVEREEMVETWLQDADDRLGADIVLTMRVNAAGIGGTAEASER